MGTSRPDRSRWRDRLLSLLSWAIGRGLFVPVAMRRLDRRDALSLYRAARPVILVQGAILAAAAYVPVLNLLIPVAGVAAMAHVAGLALARAGLPRATIYS